MTRVKEPWTRQRRKDKRRHSPGRHRRCISGLSLLEMLVVLVLTSLLSTLLIQGLGFFLSNLERVRHYGSQAAGTALQHKWFSTSVRSMVPHFNPTRAFIGEPDAFEGVTLAPLTGEPGLPRRIRWFINNGDSVHYAEPDGVNWVILNEPGAALAFEYANRAGAWRRQWRTSINDREWAPSQLRLTADDGRILWSAHLALYPEPVNNFREQW